MNAILFTPVRNIRTSLLRFPQNIQRLNGIVNFTQIRDTFDNYGYKLIQVPKQSIIPIFVNICQE